MRMMMKVQMDTEAGSRAIADGTLPPLMQQTLWMINDRITDTSEGAPPVPFQVREAFACYDDSPTWLKQA